MRTLYFYHQIKNMYEEMLNDGYETVDICGHKYDAGHALRNLDPIAFRCGCSDWVNEDYQEILYCEMTEEEQARSYDGCTMYCHKSEME